MLNSFLMLKNATFFLIFFSITTFVKAQNIDEFFIKTDEFLKKHTQNSKVDYQNIKKDIHKLHEVLDIASKIDLTNQDKNTTKAFWINAYNLLVIKGIAAKYPVKSPLDISGFFDKITHSISNMNISLNDIENNMIRAKFNDPRIHFVLVCAAKGCPPIISEAYFPQTLDKQLNAQTVLAVNNPNFIKVTAKKVELSQIFEWYKIDFVANGKNELDFINQYREAKIDEKSKISYYPYDWTLNNK